MQNSLTKKIGLSKSVLQIIAIITMFVDHIWLVGPVWGVYTPVFYTITKLIGRITIVIMCYFVAEGFHKTKDLSKYIIRMAVFAAIAQIPYYLAKHGLTITGNFNGLVVSMFYDRNVIFTLFVSLCLLTVLKSDYSLIVKLIGIVAALILAKTSDWSYYAVLWVIGFGLFYGNKKKQLIWAAVVVIIHLALMVIDPIMTIRETGEILLITICNVIASLGSLLAIPLLALYNGKRGNMPKWTFYIIYPLQFVVIILINIVL